jgi:hypothetical protein
VITSIPGRIRGTGIGIPVLAFCAIGLFAASFGVFVFATSHGDDVKADVTIVDGTKPVGSDMRCRVARATWP